MKLGIKIPSRDHWASSFRFMKFLKEGISNSKITEWASDEDIVVRHNKFVKEAYKVSSAGLIDNGFDTNSLKIQTKNVFKDEAVDKYLEENTIHLESMSYYDCNQTFIYIDTTLNTLSQV